MSWAMIGARIMRTSATTTITSWPCPSDRDEVRLRPPPKKKTRAPTSASSTMAPIMIPTIIMYSTSRFFTCPSSCAITPCSSSRFSDSSSPAVTATAAC